MMMSMIMDLVKLDSTSEFPVAVPVPSGPWHTAHTCVYVASPAVASALSAVICSERSPLAGSSSSSSQPTNMNPIKSATRYFTRLLFLRLGQRDLGHKRGRGQTKDS